ncbi:FAD-dependent monooxygenase [Actinoallomurus acaciae]|uniref:FAD-dependent monooxygenase n=1 Tax=Actinoallomurus acaciae TaxID=502577 RepID=A0ABV5YN04_9ACTN
MNERILISGASLAGLTLASWLARYGFRPTVVERAPALRAWGNGVDVRDQAVTVAERMGIMDDIRAAAADVRGMKFVDADDRAVARVPIGEPGAVEIMRGDLVALLRGTADVEYVFGDSVRSLDQDDDGVTVTFENAPDRRFDLVVGADGMHSTVRRLAFGPEERFVRFRGHYFAFADADASLGEDRCVTMYNRPGRMAGIYRSGNHPQAKGYFIFRSGRLAYDHRDVAQHRRLVREAFAGDTSWHTKELLAAALADPDFYFDALGQVRMDSWSKGRVVLTGDAAWCASPASGAGAELALVGAYRLAGELAAAGGDHRAAFPRYEASHRALVDKKHQIGANVRMMVPRTTAGRRLRNAVARSPLPRVMGALERRLQAGPRPLPEYAPAR